MKVTLVYNNDNDKNYLTLSNTNGFFINYLNMNSLHGRKEGIKILNYWSARKLPFIEVKDDEDKVVKVFYSELGNSVNQFIKWLQNDSKN